MIVYTVILDDYDTLKDPLIINPGVRYVCFTNTDMKSDIWEINKVNLTGRKASRFLKIKPPLTGTTLYVDGNLQINCSVTDLLEEYMTTDFMVLKHPQRNNITDEVRACIKLRKDDSEVLLKQLRDYGEIKSLYCNAIIARNHTNHVNNISSLWLDEVNKHSYRDQVSFPYVLQKNNYSVCTAPFSITKTHFIKTKHAK